MNWRKTTINRPREVQTLLNALTDTQRQRFSDRTSTLRSQGVEPGDAWQAAATHQRTIDLPNYEPNADEQAVLDAVSKRLEGNTSLAPVEPSVQLEVDATADSTASEDGSSGGIEPEKPTPVDALSAGDEQVVTEIPPPIATAQPSQDRGGERSDESGIDDASDPDEPTENILDNARQFLDTAAALSQAEVEQINATNDTYTISRDRQGVITLANRKTGGFLIGDENGIRNSEGLTDADQKAWSHYGQIQTSELQKQQQRRQRQQRQRREREQRQTNFEL